MKIGLFSLLLVLVIVALTFPTVEGGMFNHSKNNRREESVRKSGNRLKFW